MNASKRILLIVEGERSERKVFQKILEVMNIPMGVAIYSYRTNIHQLYQELSLDSDLDLLLTLKSKAENDRDRAILSRRYAHVYLIFDFEPHATMFDEQALRRMMEFFGDSTERGLLYINYPMFESYKHLQSMPNLPFMDTFVENPKFTEYKQLVHSESDYQDYVNYTYPVIVNLTAHHLVKALHLTGNPAEFPTKVTYERWIDRKGLETLLHRQLAFWSTGRVWIVNTSLFLVIDLLPITFFQSMTNMRLL